MRFRSERSMFGYRLHSWGCLLPYCVLQLSSVCVHVLVAHGECQWMNVCECAFLPPFLFPLPMYFFFRFPVSLFQVVREWYLMLLSSSYAARHSSSTNEESRQHLFDANHPSSWRQRTSTYCWLSALTSIAQPSANVCCRMLLLQLLPCSVSTLLWRSLN